MLASIRVPTLILVRPHVLAHNAEVVGSSKFLAEKIPGAQLVELPGEDMNPWVGESPRAYRAGR